ncbi:hypothetical protein HDV06_006240 [Boothiomyces sp. JEL0866]|nr:hypothetical protein HDV06_006240 [Boothiomyces sp. JEL0866]
MNSDSQANGGSYVYGIGWIFMHLSILCSAIIVFRILYLYKTRGFLPLTLRFPFYIAFTDLSLSFSLMLDQYHNVLFGKDWDGFMCNFTATLVGVAVFSNMILVFCISLITYLSVVRGVALDLGFGDWKLFLVVVGCSALLAGISIPSTGKSKYWINYSDYATDKSIQIMSVALETVLFCAITYFSLKVILVIQSALKILRNVQGVALSSLETRVEVIDTQHTPTLHSQVKISSASDDIRPNSTEEKSTKKRAAPKDIKTLSHTAVRKILMYIMNYFIQWFAIVNLGLRVFRIVLARYSTTMLIGLMF